MRVSVVIAVFNGARFLDEAIVSVLSQDVPPDEVIVVDDASTDGSGDVARCHDTVRVVTLPENRGPAAARNAGVSIATGDVLVFHDSDDVMRAPRIGLDLAYLEAHPEADAVLGRSRPMPPDDGELPEWARPTEAAPDDLRVAVGHVAIRRSAFELLGGYDESFRVAEDIDLLYRGRDLGVVFGVHDHATVERRIHDANLTAEAARTGLGRREQVRAIRQVAQRRRAREAPVTAIVAVRDGAAFVADAVKSILTQTRVPAQIVVVDDGSTDRTAEVLASFGGRINVERIEPSGLARARNHALTLATEEFVAFCDADDTWLPEKTEVQVRALTEPAASGGLAGADDLDGVFGGIEEFHDEALLGDRTDRVRAPMLLTTARMAQTLLVRRAALDRVGAFDPENTGGEFIEWLARAEARGLRFGSVEQIVARRRIHGDNQTTEDGWTGHLAVTLKRVMEHHRSQRARGPTTRYRPEP